MIILLLFHKDRIYAFLSCFSIYMHIKIFIQEGALNSEIFQSHAFCLLKWHLPHAHKSSLTNLVAIHYHLLDSFTPLKFHLVLQFSTVLVVSSFVLQLFHTSTGISTFPPNFLQFYWHFILSCGLPSLDRFKKISEFLPQLLHYFSCLLDFC